MQEWLKYLQQRKLFPKKLPFYVNCIDVFSDFWWSKIEKASSLKVSSASGKNFISFAWHHLRKRVCHDFSQKKNFILLFVVVVTSFEVLLFTSSLKEGFWQQDPLTLWQFFCYAKKYCRLLSLINVEQWNSKHQIIIWPTNVNR